MLSLLFISLTFICIYGIWVSIWVYMVYWCTWRALHLIPLTQDFFTDLDLVGQSTSPSEPCFLCHSTGFTHTSNHSFLCGLWSFELRPSHLHSKYPYHLPSLVFLGSFETRVFLCSLSLNLRRSSCISLLSAGMTACAPCLALFRSVLFVYDNGYQI